MLPARAASPNLQVAFNQVSIHPLRAFRQGGSASLAKPPTAVAKSQRGLTMRHALLIAVPVLLLTMAGPAFSQGLQLPNAPNDTGPASIGGPPIHMNHTSHHFWPFHRRASYHRQALHPRPALEQHAS